MLPESDTHFNVIKASTQHIQIM